MEWHADVGSLTAAAAVRKGPGVRMTPAAGPVTVLLREGRPRDGTYYFCCADKEMGECRDVVDVGVRGENFWVLVGKRGLSWS